MVDWRHIKLNKLLITCFKIVAYPSAIEIFFSPVRAVKARLLAWSLLLHYTNIQFTCLLGNALALFSAYTFTTKLEAPLHSYREARKFDGRQILASKEILLLTDFNLAAYELAIAKATSFSTIGCVFSSLAGVMTEEPSKAAAMQSKYYFI